MPVTFVPTGFNPAPLLFAFTNVGGAILVKTDIPRQEVIYSIVNGDIASGGGGDAQSVAIDCALPDGYAYAMSECWMSISGEDAEDWDPVAFSLFTDGEGSDRTLAITPEGISHGFSGNDTGTFGPTVRTYNWPIVPKVLVLPVTKGGGVTYRVKTANQTVNDTEMNLHFFARFWMYDIEQAHEYGVNVPTPVR